MNQHISILIRNAEKLDADMLHTLYSELKLKFTRYATFQVGDEMVIAALNTTEHNVIRLVEHYGIQYEISNKKLMY